MDDLESSTVIDVLKELQTVPSNRAYNVFRGLKASEQSPEELSAIWQDMMSSKPNRHDEDSSTISQASPKEELRDTSPTVFPFMELIPPHTLRQSSLLGPVRNALPPLSEAGQVSSDARGQGQDHVDVDSAVRRYRLTPHDHSATLPHFYDQQLLDLDISYWADVAITNLFAARIVALYLRTDHLMLGIFNPRLFVLGLVSKRSVFCNRFLVSAVLYFGCVRLQNPTSLTVWHL
ncbi:unnamed protein product [Clonostachys rosea f. rosea IK726]|uniref:Uncharacterized protein n=1 Tax=Clonostachys rosea f. rosea IK726 TaxID=1349383 RepID=A0ACA9UCZ1_BIOOC|nr:unnamed protein product [Clonostachys rosea f. rosea IK726]